MNKYLISGQARVRDVLFPNEWHGWQPFATQVERDSINGYEDLLAAQHGLSDHDHEFIITGFFKFEGEPEPQYPFNMNEVDLLKVCICSAIDHTPIGSTQDKLKALYVKVGEQL